MRQNPSVAPAACLAGRSCDDVVSLHPVKIFALELQILREIPASKDFPLIIIEPLSGWQSWLFSFFSCSSGRREPIMDELLAHGTVAGVLSSPVMLYKMYAYVRWHYVKVLYHSRELAVVTR